MNGPYIFVRSGECHELPRYVRPAGVRAHAAGRVESCLSPALYGFSALKPGHQSVRIYHIPQSPRAWEEALLQPSLYTIIKSPEGVRRMSGSEIRLGLCAAAPCTKHRCAGRMKVFLVKDVGPPVVFFWKNASKTRGGAARDLPLPTSSPPEGLLHQSLSEKIRTFWVLSFIV